jgi:hypothetical protein
MIILVVMEVFGCLRLLVEREDAGGTSDGFFVLFCFFHPSRGAVFTRTDCEC